MQTRVFFPQVAFDEWISEGKIELAGSELTIVPEARRYRITEAIHVRTEVSGTADPHDLFGKVKSRAFVEELGAELLQSSMLIGENAYEVTPGWVGLPVNSFAEHVASEERAIARASRRAPPQTGEQEPRTDQQLLAKFLLGSL